jgi:hypothetical protein
MQAEGHLRLGIRISESTPEHLEDALADLPSAATAIPGNGAENADRLDKMMRRYASEIERVFRQKMHEHWQALYKGKLPATCLLRLGVNAEHMRELPQKMATIVGDIFANGWPLAFGSRLPDNEHELQDVAEALLSKEMIKWDREGPLLPYSVVRTKPDFSTDEPTFFIEIKLARGSRLGAIITEMTSRVTIYRQQGAHVLFAVYDPDRVIKDDSRFAADFQQHIGIFVRVVR